MQAFCFSNFIAASFSEKFSIKMREAIHASLCSLCAWYLCRTSSTSLSLFLTLIQLVYNVIYTSHLIHMQHPHISLPLPLSLPLSYSCLCATPTASRVPLLLSSLSGSPHKDATHLKLRRAASLSCCRWAWLVPQQHHQQQQLQRQQQQHHTCHMCRQVRS